MSAVLEAPSQIADIQQLEAEIHAYELLYRMETRELLVLIAERSERLQEIEDAGFWRSSYELLGRLRRQVTQAEEKSEDPKSGPHSFLCQMILRGTTGKPGR